MPLIADDEPTVVLRFERSRKALAAYDVGAVERLKRWQSVVTAQDVTDCEREDARALIELQDAFFEDTQDINSRQACALVEVRDIRFLVDEFRFGA